MSDSQDTLEDELNAWFAEGCDLELPENFEINLPKGLSIDKDKFNTGCQHVWKTYYGLVEAFEYCEICDEKREIPDERI